MYSKIFFNLFFIVVLFVFQLSFAAALPAWLAEFNLIIITLVFFLVLTDFKLAFYWSLAIGFFLDIFSFLPFGFYIASLFLALLAINFLLNNFFTNRSLYSFLALTFFYILFYRILLLIMINIWQFFTNKKFITIFEFEFWHGLGIEILLNLAAVFILFYLLSFFGKKFKPVFLIRK